MGVMREVHVRPVLNGFIVQVGCQTLVFHRIEDVAANLIAYQNDPEGMENEFIDRAINRTMTYVDIDRSSVGVGTLSSTRLNRPTTSNSGEDRSCQAETR